MQCCRGIKIKLYPIIKILFAPYFECKRLAAIFYPCFMLVDFNLFQTLPHAYFTILFFFL